MEFLKDIASDLYNQIKDKWHSARTLILVLIIVAFGLLWASSVIDLSKFGWDDFIFSATILIGVVIFWLATARVQKAPKNKVGFGLALVTENKEQREKIYHDFILTLRTLLHNSRFRYRFAFIVYPQYFAEKLESLDHARKFLVDANLRFLIYGRVRTRIVGNKEIHVLQLEGVVSHRPIDPEFQKQFSAEFGDLFPRRMEILSENDIFSFELGADLIRIVAMYIISTASLISGDIVYSQELLESLNQELKSIRPELRELPPIVKIRNRAHSRLIDVYSIRSFSLIEQWRVTKNAEFLVQAGHLLDRLQEIDPDNYDGHVHRALWLFVLKGDIDGAKKELGQCKNIHFNSAWRYSLAFVFAYEGKVETALSEYKKAFKGDLSPGVLEGVIEFIEWILEMEPEKIQFYYFLGLIYYLKIENYFRAFEAFTDYINSPSSTKFGNLRRLAKKHLIEIKKKDERVAA